MKSIINKVAQAHPAIKSQKEFDAHYREAHPLGASLTDENTRQAFAGYNQLARKIKQQAEGKRGPQRIR